MWSWQRELTVAFMAMLAFLAYVFWPRENLPPSTTPHPPPRPLLSMFPCQALGTELSGCCNYAAGGRHISASELRWTFIAPDWSFPNDNNTVFITVTSFGASRSGDLVYIKSSALALAISILPASGSFKGRKWFAIDLTKVRSIASVSINT